MLEIESLERRVMLSAYHGSSIASFGAGHSNSSIQNASAPSVDSVATLIGAIPSTAHPGVVLSPSLLFSNNGNLTFSGPVKAPDYLSPTPQLSSHFVLVQMNNYSLELQPGRSAVESQSITIPASIAAGSYYLVTQNSYPGGADFYAVSGSTITILGGNATSIVVSTPAAEIASAGVTTSVSLGSFTETGATGPYTVDVNWGDGTAATKFAQTSPGVIPAHSHTFATAASDTVSVTVTDADAHASNVGTISVEFPFVDLVATLAGSIPASTNRGVAFSANLVISNNGNVTFTGPVQTDDYLSTTPQFSSHAVLVGVSHNSLNLQPGRSIVEPQVITIPISVAVGKYYLVAQNSFTGGADFYAASKSTMTILPATIAVTPPAAQIATAGAARSFALGSFKETSTTAPYTVNVNWGDGSAITKFTQKSAGTIEPLTHIFDKSIVDSVTVTIVDAKGNMSNVATFTATVSAAPAARLVISAQPAACIAGVALGPSITVDVEDAFGNLVTSNSSTVTLALTTLPKGGTLTGTPTAKVLKGIATFTGLSLKIAGAYTFKVTDGTLTSAISKSTTITPAAAAKLVIFEQPTTGTADVALTPDFIVDVEDAFGNFVLTDASTVTLAIYTDPAGAKLTGTPTIKAIKGIARFGALSLSKPGNYTLKITDGKLTPAISKTVNVKA